MAHQIHDLEIKRQYFSINVGVILFNLHHPMLRRIVWLWNIICYVRIMVGGNDNDNDQSPIQRDITSPGCQTID
jgi:hypothetical protein